jgi:glyoxylase-like metal-dependent hydrolase (beta-lactamase superfamily II)
MNHIELGSARIQTIQEGVRQSLDIAALTNDRDFIAAQKDWMCPDFFDPVANTFDLVFQSYLVNAGDRVLVVDPCIGNGKTREVLRNFDHLDGPFIERFEATGTRVEDVTTVFCTHLHCDHCGWNTQLRNGKWVPTFPNARYIFVQRELDRWDPRRPGHKAVAFNAGTFEDSVLPILQSGLADLVPDTHSLGGGIFIEPAYGHTDGHSMLRLTSGKQEAYFVGDAVHHPLQILRPELDFAMPDDPEAAVATRIRLRERASETGALVLPAHFAAPGYITKNAGEFGFKPVK